MNDNLFKGIIGLSPEQISAIVIKNIDDLHIDDNDLPQFFVNEKIQQNEYNGFSTIGKINGIDILVDNKTEIELVMSIEEWMEFRKRNIESQKGVK